MVRTYLALPVYGTAFWWGAVALRGQFDLSGLGMVVVVFGYGLALMLPVMAILYRISNEDERQLLREEMRRPLLIPLGGGAVAGVAAAAIGFGFFWIIYVSELNMSLRIVTGAVGLIALVSAWIFILHALKRPSGEADSDQQTAAPPP